MQDLMNRSSNLVQTQLQKKFMLSMCCGLTTNPLWVCDWYKLP